MSVSSASEVRGLRELAECYQVETSYVDVEHNERAASPESLLAVLRVLGAPVENLADAPNALRQRRLEIARRVLEPVTVVWEDEPAKVVICLPEKEAEGRAELRLTLENGQAREWRCNLAALPTVERCSVEGATYVRRAMGLGSIPRGYHELQVVVSGQTVRTQIIAAPRRAYDPVLDSPQDASERSWGAFLPLYALRAQNNRGSATFEDINRFAEWIYELGGTVVATLPLLAAFLDEPFEPSPYSPASRLFWNEFYLDVPGISSHEAAPLVDYRRQMQQKRFVLEESASAFFRDAGGDRRRFEAFLNQRPEVEDYAQFRATTERRRAPWYEWPDRLKNGRLERGDFEEASRNYHLYVQWLAEEQMSRCARSLRERGQSLYLDLPLGVNGAGYDVWREQSAFALGASGGCPPDAVFRNGQDWGFPPLHPEGIREQGYRYITAYLKHQLRHAGVLRIDHMPVFHHLYWVPQGMPATDGVYVRYPAEELYAVFNLESHRHRVLLVGEDLGTVPPEVPEAMKEHHVFGMYVAQYAARPDPQKALPTPPTTSIASLNTHDMPPFAAYVKGKDIEERQQFRLLGDLDPEKEREKRTAIVDAIARFLQIRDASGESSDQASLLRACLHFLATSPARTVLINLEDIWLEEASQNMPGTSAEHPNWRRKARYTFEELSQRPEVLEILQAVQHDIRSSVEESPGNAMRGTSFASCSGKDASLS
jgi:4-alpha-glucanotransferase